MLEFRFSFFFFFFFFNLLQIHKTEFDCIMHIRMKSVRNCLF